MTVSIWWVRRDLRLTDNEALSAALAAAEQVTPVFVLDERLLHSRYVGEKRTAFLLDGLRCLDADLRRVGSRLLVRRGDPAAVIPQLCRETSAAAVYAQRDDSPFAVRRDAAVRSALSVPLHLMAGVTAHPPESVHKDDGSPFIMQAPFAKRWRSFGPLRRGDLLPTPQVIRTPAAPRGESIPAAPALPSSVPFAAGEEAGRRRLAAFTAGDAAPVFRYAELRNQPALDATSQLSPYLRWGMVSPRLAAVSAYEAIERAAPDGAKGADSWLAELIWREFCIAILHHFAHVRSGSFKPQMDNIAWRDDDADFRAWCEGRTGYPVVDAAMRQLVTEGWMHNRCRLITASFLVKDLLIDWRRGEQFFMQHLIDGDPAANNGNWQWVAGSAADAAPPFRVFNPALQAQKFDPDGAYVRRWLPELARVPARFIHQPWLMAKSEQTKAHCILGEDYPPPVVHHAAARERALAAYRQSRT